MEWLFDPTIWVGLFTLVLLEIVLGIDNLIFIAILADKLPPHQRDKARLLGLSLAMGMRLGLLTIVSWLVTLTTPLFSLGSFSFSGRDLILLVGGVFLLFKAARAPGRRGAYAVGVEGICQLRRGRGPDRRARRRVLARRRDHRGRHGR